ncbi:hypothetical protein [Helicobacter canis]|uniref:Uncharacterized protein n=1 Tax=Helicobacter canis TaxID=29419 RepID=A0A377J5B1_9HELI|nr:hypothetical protein [Helicobacter canis]STO97495.1 Uncharacterised protein [Helicobacter canis]
MGILTFIFWIIVLMLVIWAGGALMAIGLVVLMFAAIIKGLEQGYHWYIGEPFEVIWIIGGGIALLFLLYAFLSKRDS